MGFESRRASLTGLMGAGVALVGMATFLSFFARMHFRFEQLTHFRLQYVLLLLPPLVIYYLRRKRIAAGITLVLFLVHFYYLFPYIRISKGKVRDDSLRILVSNVLSDNEEHAKLLNLVEKKEPDIVVLQEITPKWEKAVVAPLRASYPYGSTQSSTGNFGIALLSRLPGQYGLNYLGVEVPSVWGEFEWRGKAGLILGIHAIPPVTVTKFEQRNRQFQKILEWVKKVPSAIVVGDLNVTPFSPYYTDLLDAGLRDPRRQFGLHLTWPVGMFPLRIPIDHALAGRGWRFIQFDSGPDIGSDHFPVYIELSQGD